MDASTLFRLVAPGLATARGGLVEQPAAILGYVVAESVTMILPVALAFAVMMLLDNVFG